MISQIQNSVIYLQITTYIQ